MKATNPNAKPDVPVFVNTRGKRITTDAITNCWYGKTNRKGYSPGIVMQLAQEGKIRRYLKPYCTRHTLITAAIFECVT